MSRASGSRVQVGSGDQGSLCAALVRSRRGAATAKKKAVIAVARKLAVLLHRLWVTGEVYEPLRHTNRRAAAQTQKSTAVTV